MAFTRFATSEPWDPASGPRLNKLGDELEQQINDCLQYRCVINSMSQISKDGYYYVNIGDSTFPYAYGIVKIESGGGESVATYDTTGNDKKTYKNVKTSGSGWTAWVEIATTTKTSLSLFNGWVLETGSNTITKIGDRCFTSFCIKGGSVNSADIVANIPIGFRPIAYTILESHYGYTYNDTILVLATDGNITLAPIGSSSISTNERLFLNLSWEVA